MSDTPLRVASWIWCPFGFEACTTQSPIGAGGVVPRVARYTLQEFWPGKFRKVGTLESSIDSRGRSRASSGRHSRHVDVAVCLQQKCYRLFEREERFECEARRGLWKTRGAEVVNRVTEASGRVRIT